MFCTLWDTGKFVAGTKKLVAASEGPSAGHLSILQLVPSIVFPRVILEAMYAQDEVWGQDYTFSCSDTFPTKGHDQNGRLLLWFSSKA